MSDLRRWFEEGATAEEISLLETSQRERPPADARDRTLMALGLAAAVTTTATASTTAAAATTAATTTAATTTAATATAATTTGAAVVATTGGLTVLTKVLAVSMLGGIVAGGVVVRASHRQKVVPSTHASVASSTHERTIVESANREFPSPPASNVVGPVSFGPPARSALPASTEDRLSREVSALELAHRALADHNPESALRLLDRYRASFPAGTLASEETVLRLQALLATGERTRAQALADAYSTAHPDSPYSRRLEDLVHNAQQR